jgi:glycosyltransferase involved in cell wall biosynthesis
MNFSVVVCTYNYAHLLPDTLRTIAAQTARDFELVIVDDGSTDGTEQIVEQFRPQFQDCRYLKKPHSGLADSRNVGVRAAQGTHIAFLDADDLWSPHYLSTIRETLSAHPQAGLALCEGILFRSSNGFITEAVPYGNLPRLHGPVDSPLEIFAIIQAAAPSGMVFSKELYNSIGPFDLRFLGSLGDDIDWIFRALMARVFCICIKERLYLYRRHGSNLTNSAGNSYRVWLALYNQMLKESRTDPQVEALARGVIRSNSLRFLPTCSTSEGRRLLREAIDTLGGDPWVRLCYFGTYMGLVVVLKLSKGLKRFGHLLFRKRLAIDLNSSYDTVFGALPK